MYIYKLYKQRSAIEYQPQNLRPIYEICGFEWRTIVGQPLSLFAWGSIKKYKIA